MEAIAAVLHESKSDFVLEKVQLEAPRAGEVLVRIVAVGMCHTDIVVRDNGMPTPLPVVLGHEGAGIIEAVGEGVTKVAPGDPVVLTYLSCGACRCCDADQPTYCESLVPLNFFGQRLDGSSPISMPDGTRVGGLFFGQSSFASHAIANERNVVKAPADVDLAMLGPLGCGFQTGAGAVMNVLKPGTNSNFAVYGSGSVGMSAIMAAHALGVPQIIAVDLNPERLEMAKELGATDIINAAEEDVKARMMAITGRGTDTALDTTGNAKVLRQAADALASPGTLGMVGQPEEGAQVSFDMFGLMLGRRLVGIVEGDSDPDVFIPYLIELYKTARFPIDKLIKFYDLADINQAAKDSESGRVIKPVLRP